MDFLAALSLLIVIASAFSCGYFTGKPTKSSVSLSC